MHVPGFIGGIAVGENMIKQAAPTWSVHWIQELKFPISCDAEMYFLVSICS